MKYITWGWGDKTDTSQNNETTQETKKIIVNTLRPGLCGDDPFTTVRLPRRSISSQSFGK